MSSEPLASPGEFRRYRRFLSWFLLSFVSLGSVYLLGSVGVTIYRWSHAVPTGSPIGSPASVDDLESCAEELTDVQQGLGRHLENFHHLLAHYDAGEAQRWSEDRSFWLGHWKSTGERCRYAAPRSGPFQKEWEELQVIHQQLRDTEASYTKELLRFGQTQAPRLDQIGKRLESVVRRIATASPSSHAGAPAPTDPGDRKP